MRKIETQAEFIETLSPEFNRAWKGVTENSVESYAVYVSLSGELEVMASPIKFDGAKFWEIDGSVAEWQNPQEYLEFYGEEIFSAYQAVI